MYQIFRFFQDISNKLAFLLVFNARFCNESFEDWCSYIFYHFYFCSSFWLDVEDRGALVDIHEILGVQTLQRVVGNVAPIAEKEKSYIIYIYFKQKVIFPFVSESLFVVGA